MKLETVKDKTAYPVSELASLLVDSEVQELTKVDKRGASQKMTTGFSTQKSDVGDAITFTLQHPDSLPVLRIEKGSNVVSGDGLGIIRAYLTLYKMVEAANGQSEKVAPLKAQDHLGKRWVDQPFAPVWAVLPNLQIAVTFVEQGQMAHGAIVGENKDYQKMMTSVKGHQEVLFSYQTNIMQEFGARHKLGGHISNGGRLTAKGMNLIGSMIGMHNLPFRTLEVLVPASEPKELREELQKQASRVACLDTVLADITNSMPDEFFFKPASSGEGTDLSQQRCMLASLWINAIRTLNLNVEYRDTFEFQKLLVAGFEDAKTEVRDPAFIRSVINIRNWAAEKAFDAKAKAEIEAKAKAEIEAKAKAEIEADMRKRAEFAVKVETSGDSWHKWLASHAVA